MIVKRVFILVILISFIIGCTKEENLEVAGNEPIISFVALSPLVVEDFNNSISLIIHYKDQNGDLGFSNPDEYSLWVKDSRLDSADWYQIAPLAPLGQELKIEGDLNIVLNSLFIIGNGNQEVISLAVKLRDQANNWSNVIYTPSIIIKKS